MTTRPRRLGLVVATTEYDDSRLARLGAPLSDALELARILTDHGGFEVETLINAEAQTVQRRIEKFCKTGRHHSDLLFVYLSVIPFMPASELFYVETEVTSYLSGSLCGLALQNQAGFVLTVGLGNGQVIARLYSGGTETNSGFWEVAVTDPVETEIGLWVDGTSVSIYVDDVELATFDEPTMVGVTEAGVSLMGGLETYCGFDYLVGYNG